jgi:TRAP-type mannitol/chloroaromatic compound transport system permease small subunit
MEKLRNTLNKVLNLLAGLSMTVMVVLTTYQVIVRYIFNSSIYKEAGRAFKNRIYFQLLMPVTFYDCTIRPGMANQSSRNDSV